LVDKDVVDVTRFVDAFEHRLERRPLVHAPPTASGLDVLVDDLDAHQRSLPFARGALGGYREALGVVVGVDLCLRAAAEVGESALRTDARFVHLRIEGSGPEDHSGVVDNLTLHRSSFRSRGYWAETRVPIGATSAIGAEQGPIPSVRTTFGGW